MVLVPNTSTSVQITLATETHLAEGQCIDISRHNTIRNNRGLYMFRSKQQILRYVKAAP